MNDPMTSITRLRQIAAAASAGQSIAPEDAAWLGAAIGRYLDAAALGLSLEDVFGITPAAGQSSWWRVEARERRNAALRELRERHFGSLDIPKAAREIGHLVRQVSREPGASSDPDVARLAGQAASAGAAMLGVRQIANVLKG